MKIPDRQNLTGKVKAAILRWNKDGNKRGFDYFLTEGTKTFITINCSCRKVKKPELNSLMNGY